MVIGVAHNLHKPVRFYIFFYDICINNMLILWIKTKERKFNINIRSFLHKFYDLLMQQRDAHPQTKLHRKKKMNQACSYKTDEPRECDSQCKRASNKPPKPAHDMQFNCNCARERNEFFCSDSTVNKTRYHNTNTGATKTILF